MLYQVAKYSFFAVLCLLIDFSILSLLLEFELDYLLANSVSYSTATVAFFFLCQAFVFQQTNKYLLARGILFFVVGVIGLCIQNIVIHASVKYLSEMVLLGKSFAVMISFAFSFLMRKWIMSSGLKKK